MPNPYLLWLSDLATILSHLFGPLTEPFPFPSMWWLYSRYRYTPSQADVSVFKAITSPPTTTNVLRWYNHIKSYTAEFESLPGSSEGGKAFLGGGAFLLPRNERLERPPI